MPSPGSPARIIAATFSLAAFSVSVVTGLAVDNPADVVLSRALGAMVITFAVGSLLGLVLEHALTQRGMSAAPSTPPSQSRPGFAPAPAPAPAKVSTG